MKSFKGAKPLNENIKTTTYDNSLNRWINVGLIKTVDDVPKSYKKILEFINTGKTANKQYKEYSDNSKILHTSALLYFLKTKKVSQKIINQISKKNTIRASSVEDKLKDNKRSDRRNVNPVHFDQLKKAYDQLYQKFQDDSITRKEHIQLIILAIYTLQPPIRSEPSNMKIFKASPKSSYKENSIVITKSKAYYDMQDFKTKRKYGNVKIDLSDDLHEFLLESLEKMKRSYLIPSLTDNNKPIGYLQMLREIKSITGSPSAGIDVLRSAYVNNFLKSKYTYRQKEKLAEQMLTSVNRLDVVYTKLDNDSSDSDDDKSECCQFCSKYCYK